MDVKAQNHRGCESRTVDPSRRRNPTDGSPSSRRSKSIGTRSSIQVTIPPKLRSNSNRYSPASSIVSVTRSRWRKRLRLGTKRSSSSTRSARHLAEHCDSKTPRSESWRPCLKLSARGDRQSWSMTPTRGCFAPLLASERTWRRSAQSRQTIPILSRLASFASAE